MGKSEIADLVLQDPQAAKVFKRLSVLHEARGFVEILLERYPPEAYRSITQTAGPFQAVPSYTVTSSEQAWNLIKDVAEWLMEE